MRPRSLRPALLLLALASLATGIWGGLLRMSWQLPLPVEHANWISYHGPLLVAGFFGTLIGVERAVALGRPWAWLAPALTGAGGLVVAAGVLGAPGPALVAAGAGVFLAVTVVLGRRQPGEPAALMTLGALAWVAGAVLWLARWDLARVTVFWVAYFVFTIAGERLELARIRPAARSARGLFRLANVLLLAGLLISLWLPAAGERCAAAGLFLIAAWLLRFDIARTTLRSPGVAGFAAVALLAAYFWLVAGAVLLAIEAPLEKGLGYDAALHALLVGFVFGMVFGHGPIILPAVLGRPAAFRRLLYAPLALLHASLLLRVAADHAGWHDGRRWGGMLGAVAVVAFLLAMLFTMARPPRGGARRPGKIAAT